MSDGVNIAAKSIIGTIAYVAGYIKGSFNELLVILAIFMVCDYISGTVLAVARNEFSVKKGLYGAIKKLFYVFLVLMGFLLDMFVTITGTRLGLSFETKGALGMAINCYLIGTEGLSIVESLVAMGLPVPEFLKKALGIIKNKSEKTKSSSDE